MEDNPMQLDLVFSDGEIADAMKRAARAYNAIPPFVSRVSSDSLPDDTNMFLDAIAMHLYISRYAKLSRQDVDYSAGNLTANEVRAQLAHMKEMIQAHKVMFEETARSHKTWINASQAWGHF
jgi:hypothetical protein